MHNIIGDGIMQREPSIHFPSRGSPRTPPKGITGSQLLQTRMSYRRTTGVICDPSPNIGHSQPRLRLGAGLAVATVATVARLGRHLDTAEICKSRENYHLAAVLDAGLHITRFPLRAPCNKTDSCLRIHLLVKPLVDTPHLALALALPHMPVFHHGVQEHRPW